MKLEELSDSDNSQSEVRNGKHPCLEELKTVILVSIESTGTIVWNRVLNFQSPIDVGVKIEKPSDSESIAKDKKLSDDMIENNIKVWPFAIARNLTLSLYKVTTEVQY